MGWREHTADLILRGGIVLAALCVLAGGVMAHKITVFAYTEGKRVTVEGYFGDGRKAGNAKVEVIGSKGEILLEGRTDGEGIFSFPVEVPMDLTIFVTDGAGHKNSFLLHKEKFQGHYHEPEKSTDDVPGEMAPGADRKGAGIPLYPGVSEEMLERVLDRKIAPITRELGEMRKIMERPSLRDVAGGIGYIVGLAGLIFFLLGKKGRKGR